MAARILDGRALAADLRDEISTRAERLRARGIAPRLVVAIVGEDAASIAYVRSIEKVGAKVGVDVRVDAMAAGAGEDDVRAHLRALGDDPLVHGIILQQPLPPHLGIRRIAEAMPPHKDVDGSNPVNLGRLAFASGTELVPATPMACMLLLERSERWPLRGVRACVVGRSNVVGLPVALLLMARDATVTIAHSKTRDLAARTREADVLVAASGKPGLIRADMVAPGATVIDVGTTFVDGKLTGDVAYDEVAEVAGEITPVPGGVGPVTNVALLRNVVVAAERQTSAT
ncbi:MAG: methylenetetrahydrofolate dehydrogenase / methenyltetrahydrofolate cyclohydrolase [Candidatus Eremiobacteraeota bacterium]|jgi:methylenetetrahydrofolate dehydrogenase (NADP+)/methenyltetrahydrofolate cyclohydrolase|nr:methylenetetrahydrofolate dehydrogenase / methenyltetrahydrofolate cyclohydrolase [Candidatus Eremiobacteraeota bacterium]